MLLSGRKSLNNLLDKTSLDYTPEWLNKVIWVIVFLIHSLSCFHLFLMAIIHNKLSSPAEMQALRMDYRRLSMAIFFVFSALHLQAVISMLSCSKARSVAMVTKWDSKTSQYYVVRQYYKFRHWHAMYLGKHGLFGLYGPLYEYRLGLREMTEIPSQAYQAYQMSQFIADHTTSFAYVSLIALNSLISPLLLVSKRYTFRRNISVLLDSIFDFIFSAMFPLTLLAWSIIEYTIKGNRNAMRDLSVFIEALRIGRQAYISGLLDLVTTVLPFAFNYSMLRGLMDSLSEQKLRLSVYPEDKSRVDVKPKKTPLSSEQSTENSEQHDKDKHESQCSLRNTSHILVEKKQSQQIALVHLPPERRREFKEILETNGSLKQFLHIMKLPITGKIIFIVSIMWSIMLLSIGFDALHREECPPACTSASAPWFTSDCRCFTYILDCELYDLHDEATIHNHLRAIPSSVEGLELRKCLIPHGIPPSVIERLPDLAFLRITESQMTEWDLPVEVIPPYLQMVRIRYSNLTRIPEFLLKYRRETFNVVIIADSKLTSANIPKDLSHSWRYHVAINLHGNMLTEWLFNPVHLPRLENLQLSNNQLKVVPMGLEESPHLRTIDLTGNLLTAVPAEISTLPDMKTLSLNGNPLLSLPEGWQPFLEQLKIFDISDTPICERFNSGEQNALLASVSDTFPDLCVPSCKFSCPKHVLGDYDCDLKCNVEQCSFDKQDCSKYY